MWIVPHKILDLTGLIIPEAVSPESIGYFDWLHFFIIFFFLGNVKGQRVCLQQILLAGKL